jgi:hypothetical protein
MGRSTLKSLVGACQTAGSLRKRMMSWRMSWSESSASPEFGKLLGMLPLPGEDLVRQGVADLARGLETVPGLLVAIGAPRLRRLGFSLPEMLPVVPEHRLYELLSVSEGDAAHARYNALIRRLVSFERAAECGAR